jgi:hypothetical protein
LSGVGEPANAPRKIAINLSLDFAMTDGPEDKEQNIGFLAKLLMGDELWSADWKIHLAHRDHVFAMGVISSNYNHLELCCFWIFRHYMNDSVSGVPQMLFGRLDNARRVEYLREYAKHEPHPDARGCVNHFLSGYWVCAENRNFIMHSSIDSVPSGPVTDFGLRKRAKSNYVSVTAKNVDAKRLRLIANEIDRFDSFGWATYLFLVAQRLGGRLILDGKPIVPALPEKPPLPELLVPPTDPALPANKPQSPQPQASGKAES